MSKTRKIAYSIALVVVGVILGGYLFSDTQPRSILALHRCEQGQCLKANDFAGLIGSVGLQKLNGLMPAILFETDKVVVVNYPTPRTSFHEVIIPKKDIKDVSNISPEDMPYIMDTFAYVSKAVKENNLIRYKVVTNGPGYQNVTYLHFHLIGELEKQK